MRNINILSLVQAYTNLEKDGYTNFLNYYGIEIKSKEVEDLKSLVNTLYDQTRNKNIFNYFYVSYKIPQIGKEFDLLRFGEECVINIELKSTCTEERIQNQLQRNYYYLGYIGKRIYNFSFISNTGQLYNLNNNKIEKVDFSFLVRLLIDQKNIYINNVDDLFNPSNYLVSPFNSTKKFLENKYFLTHQQEEVKNQIINNLNGSARPNFISVTGSAGTGKTLLIYDIAKEIRKNKKKPLIIHCGYLNNGQEELKRHGWEIISIKDSGRYELSNYDVVFVDEAQRIYSNQLTMIVDKLKSINGNCIFSYDKLQTLAKWEENRDIDGKINNISSIVNYKLSEKIRTNKEISEFIKALFNKKRSFKLSNKDNIQLFYFKSIEDAKDFIGTLRSHEWEVLRFTPSQYKSEHHEKYSEISSKTSHKVIGQEFDSVVVMIDKFFSYDKNGDLIYRGNAYYHPVKMLFQNITRTRKRLNLVIIDNDELLNRCMSILDH